MLVYLWSLLHTLRLLRKLSLPELKRQFLEQSEHPRVARILQEIVRDIIGMSTSTRMRMNPKIPLLHPPLINPIQNTPHPPRRAPHPLLSTHFAPRQRTSNKSPLFR